MIADFPDHWSVAVSRTSERIKSAGSMSFLRAGLPYCTFYAAIFLLPLPPLHVRSILDQTLSIAFSNMFLPYALLFFLFTNFVTAAPLGLSFLATNQMSQFRDQQDFLKNGVWTTTVSIFLQLSLCVSDTLDRIR